MAGKSKLNEEDIQNLLYRLSTDDDFRAQIEHNPGKILEEYNIDELPAAGVIPKSVTLPSKQDVVDNHDTYVENIQSAEDSVFGFIWHHHL
jgi:putative modified peptide